MDMRNKESLGDRTGPETWHSVSPLKIWAQPSFIRLAHTKRKKDELSPWKGAEVMFQLRNKVGRDSNAKNTYKRLCDIRMSRHMEPCVQKGIMGTLEVSWKLFKMSPENYTWENGVKPGGEIKTQELEVPHQSFWWPGDKSCESCTPIILRLCAVGTSIPEERGLVQKWCKSLAAIICFWTAAANRHSCSSRSFCCHW